MRISGLVRDLKKQKILAGYWLVGSAFAREASLDLLVAGVGALPEARTNISLLEDAEVDLWTALNSYGTGERRLVVVRAADLLWAGEDKVVEGRVERLGSWLADPAVKNVTAVFVDRAVRWGKDDLTRPGRARELFVGGFTARATWIDSSVPLKVSARFTEELSDMVAALGGVGPDVASAVVTGAGHDVGVAVNAARKLAKLTKLGVVPSVAGARALALGGSGGRFTESLLSMDKRAAVKLIPQVTSVRGSLLALERGLGVLARAHVMKRPSDSLMVLTEKLGVNFSTAQLASLAASHYGHRACLRRAKLLSEALSVPANRPGVLSLVVMGW